MKDSENKFTLPLIGGCAIAMGIFAFAWHDSLVDLMHDPVYVWVAAITAILFAVCAVIAEVKRDDPNYDKFRWIALAFAVAFCLWCGVWKSDRAAKKDDKIDYKYEQSK